MITDSIRNKHTIPPHEYLTNIVLLQKWYFYESRVRIIFSTNISCWISVENFWGDQYTLSSSQSSESPNQVSANTLFKLSSNNITIPRRTSLFLSYLQLISKFHTDLQQFHGNLFFPTKYTLFIKMILLVVRVFCSLTVHFKEPGLFFISIEWLSVRK